MSVCVVASYPWAKIAGLADLDEPGVVVCSDTRATQGSDVLIWKFSKQRLTAPNILVCYTTSHGAATTAALQQSWGRRDVRRISEALKVSHATYGGLTELLVVVWRRGGTPQILELMPPSYRPQPRSGIIGIGDPGPLEWFRANFEEDPRPRLELSTPTPELVFAVAQHFGEPIEFPSVRYTIRDAALSVGSALTVGIQTSGGRTVGLPIQAMIVHRGEVEQIPIVMSSADLKDFSSVTVEHHETKLPAPVFPRIPLDGARRRATQLFD